MVVFVLFAEVKFACGDCVAFGIIDMLGLGSTVIECTVPFAA